MSAKQFIYVLATACGVLWPARGQDFGFGNYEVVSSTRVGRTQFEYVLRVTITNGVATAQGVSAQVFSLSAHTEIVEGEVSFGDVSLSASARSADTFTIRQNRLYPFDPGQLQWFALAQTMPLLVHVTDPPGGYLTNGSQVVVAGTVGPAVAGVRVQTAEAAVSGGVFSAGVTLEEGRNTITVLATNRYGGLGTASVVVNRDTVAPLVSIQEPAAEAVLAARQITVSGLVNDAVPGTVNPEQAIVMVNGLPGTVLNRTYSLSDVLLVPGRNVIRVVAQDRAGNESTTQIGVTFVDPARQKRLNALGGDAQMGMIGSLLADPLLVELVDGDGVPQTNQPVTFSVTRADGLVVATPDSGRSLTLLTDDKGQARVRYLLGTRTGVGNNQATASSAGVLGDVRFNATATGAPPAKVSALIPESQVGAVGQPLPLPWSAFVTDDGGNPVEGAPITFRVHQGGGNFYGASTVSTNTDGDGRASAILTLGPGAGVNNNVAVAAVPGVTDSSAVFTATALTARQAADTRILGVVLDPANRPMSNILCSLPGTALNAVTDAQGQFVLSGVPVGAVRLFVDGRNRGYPGEWHYLQFDLVTVAGQDNSVDRPIYMLNMDEAGAQVAGGAQDVTLQLAGIAGSAMTIAAHSLRDANGQPITNLVSWTQVNAQRVPMQPPSGSQFSLAWSVQPANLRFEPPAKVCIPNTLGQPGQVLELFGFDHDIGAFVSLGTGTVTPDGAQICSDPGFGIVKSGWGGAAPPPPPCTPVCSGPPPDGDCYTYETIPPASRCDCPTYQKKPKAGPCDDGDPCTVRDTCTNNVCKGEKIEITKVEPKVEGTNDLVRCYMTNQMLSFTAEVTQTNCSMLEYKWEFGDGQTSDQQSPTHAYTNGGDYSVKLTVSCKDCPAAKKDGTAKVKLYQLKKLIVADNANASNVKTNPADSNLIMLSTNTAKAKISAEIEPNTAEAKKRILWRVDGSTAAPNKGDFSAGTATVDLTITGGNRSFPIKAGCDENKDGTLQDGEVTHTLTFHLATVSFEKNAGQKFGFDEDKTNGVHYVSLDKADTTKVNVKVDPFVADGYWATSSDKTKMTVTGDGKLAAALAMVEVNGANAGGDHEALLLEIRSCTNTGPILTNIHVEIYKENQVAKVSYYRILDSAVAATTPAQNPSLEFLKAEMNKIYKQAVVEILDVDGSTNKDIRFDLNNNGILDWYFEDADDGPEVKAITSAGLTGDPKMAYVEKVRKNFRLAGAVAAGSTNITVNNIGNLVVGQTRTIGPATGAGAQNFTIHSIAGNTIRTTTPLAAHAATDTVYYSLAGLSTDPQLVTDAGGELLVTIVHEMMHRAVFGNLSDVGQTDNVMYWTTGGTGDGFLRFRPQTVVNTGNGVPTGGTENQWNKVAR